MSGRIDLDASGKRLRITFPYHPSLVDIVRGFEGRRFIKAERAWTVPVTEVVDVVDALRPRHFDLAVEVLALYEECVGAPPADEPAVSVETLTISQLNGRARDAILAAFPDRVWVVGEISGFDRWRHRRTVHFQLAEKRAEEDDLVATVNAILFADARERLEETLRQAADPFDLHDGVEVRLLVRVDLYAPLGVFQVVVDEIDPVHTLGKLAERRRMILEELGRRRLLDRNRELEMPVLPLRIGLVTSAGSDAYNDLVNELQSSGFSFDVMVFDAVMQGPRLESSLLRALEYFARPEVRPDLLVISRGGGSRADLSWFDTLEIALAVARHPVKIVTAIGHQRDVAVIDMIALAVKTPTAAAALVIDRVEAASRRLQECASRVVDLARARLLGGRCRLEDRAKAIMRLAHSRLESESARLTALAVAIPRSAVRDLRSSRQAIGSDSARLDRAARSVLLRGRAGLGTMLARLRTANRTRLRAARRELDRLRRAVAGPRLVRSLGRHRERLDGLAAKLRALDPRQVLRRGYALIRTSRGDTLRDAREIELGEEIQAHLAQGALRARVTARDVTDHQHTPDRKSR